MSQLSKSRPVANTALGKATLKYLLWIGIILFIISAGIILDQQTDLMDQVLLWFGEETPWFITRSTGVVAYVLLSLSMYWGLILSTKSVRGQVPSGISLATHTVMSWLAVLLSVIHAAVLRASTFYEYAWADILLPFRGPYRPFWVGLGIVALYLMVVVNVSFDWRRWLGQRTWRWLHYTTFLIYLFVSIHVIQSGSDMGNIGMQALVFGSIAIFLFLTLFRLLLGNRQKARRTA
ncbi:MAG: ferric reductase-like transmembrane domain-containing protein [Chloroflexota bacterium]